jgi:hypothetical protein
MTLTQGSRWATANSFPWSIDPECGGQIQYKWSLRKARRPLLDCTCHLPGCAEGGLQRIYASTPPLRCPAARSDLSTPSDGVRSSRYSLVDDHRGGESASVVVGAATDEWVGCGDGIEARPDLVHEVAGRHSAEQLAALRGKAGVVRPPPLVDELLAETHVPILPPGEPVSAGALDPDLPVTGSGGGTLRPPWRKTSSAKRVKVTIRAV